jgi:anti-anti-sigma factor
MSGITFDRHEKYCGIQFTHELRSMTWDQTEAATNRIVQMIAESRLRNVLVTAPGLDALPDGVLGVLLKVWKTLDPKTRKLIFVTESASVSSELEISGLLLQWKVMKNRESALQFLQLDDTREIDVMQMRTEALKNDPSARSATAVSEQTVTTEPFTFENHKRYCLIRFHTLADKLSWSDQEAMMTAAISQYELANVHNLMIDLSEIRYINSGGVAGMIRLWKSAQKRTGHFSVVCPCADVLSVLKASGLTKVWSITEDREDSAYDLGVSHSALAEKRERTLLVGVSLPCALLAAAFLIPMFMKRESVLGVNSQLAALLLSSAAGSTGLLGILREEGFRRKLCIFSTVVALLVLSTVWFKDNPISFRKTYPDYEFQRD